LLIRLSEVQCGPPLRDMAGYEWLVLLQTIATEGA